MSRILVCGGRDYYDQDRVYKVLDDFNAEAGPVRLLIEGGAQGADALARKWGFSRGVHVATVHALWAKRGRAAGWDRNLAMLSLEPRVVIAFPGGRGTANMVQIAKDAGVQVMEIPA